jgi:hypothetical protein
VTPCSKTLNARNCRMTSEPDVRIAYFSTEIGADPVFERMPGVSACYQETPFARPGGFRWDHWYSVKQRR